MKITARKRPPTSSEIEAQIMASRERNARLPQARFAPGGWSPTREELDALKAEAARKRAT